MIKNRIRCRKCEKVKSKAVKLIRMNSLKWECAMERDFNIQSVKSMTRKQNENEKKLYLQDRLIQKVYKI